MILFRCCDILHLKVINMEYISTIEAAKRWGISDRRVRILCREGKIKGAVLDKGKYNIPSDAKKPADGRRKLEASEIRGFLKWENDVVGIIDSRYCVQFTSPLYNDVVEVYTRGNACWSYEQFSGFLSERIVSRDRRDIEKILFRCGFSVYDVLKIAFVTRGIHPKDLLWIAFREDEKFSDAMTEVFNSVFLLKTDLQGDSIDTPEGYNIKRYGVFNGKYGIFKKRINPLVTDAESEIAVYKLACRLGIPCCPVYYVDKDTVFSEFLYDFSKEYIVHFRRLFESVRSENEYENLISVRPQYRDDIIRMLLLDFITRQDDRHLSNIAVKITGSEECFYPLYDNGRSLFYEDTPETAENSVRDIELYATSFGYSGTYYDHLKSISDSGICLSSFIDTSITDEEIKEILLSSGFRDYRLECSVKWIRGALDIVCNL